MDRAKHPRGRIPRGTVLGIELGKERFGERAIRVADRREQLLRGTL